jgi:hypothetical protein
MKIKFAQSKNLLKKFAHSRNLLTEFACSIEKLLTMKNLGGSDGSTRWLNVSHQANRSTAGVHHSTDSVKTAETYWPDLPGRSGNMWQIVNEGIYVPAGGETTSRSMSGWLKTGLASAIILLNRVMRPYLDCK